MNQLLVAVALVAACGHGQKGGGSTGDGGTAGSGSGAGGGSAIVVADGPITRPECERMANHVLDIGIAAMPVEERPTDAALVKVRASMLADEQGMAQCLAFDRAVWTCVMEAQDIAALNSCLGPE